MSAELPFEYSQRRNALLRDAIIGDEATREAALHAIEEGDRELEDYLANLPTGGGGVSENVIAVYSAATQTSGNGGPVISGTLTTTFAVPADTSFNYYADWEINGHSTQNISTAQVFAILGQGRFNEFVPGAGFEKWGYRSALNAGAAQNPSYCSGRGGRIEPIPDAYAGTTINFLHEFTIENYNSLSYGASFTTQIRLIAIPAATDPSVVA